jgi:transcription initiation factor TFIIIB Brf1 subunit/transcription initiation factor TFIIB
MICPYCEVEISMSAVDAEDGYCPECGVLIAATSIFQDGEDEHSDDLDDIYDDDF